jgi:rhamnosyltransferase
VVIFLTQDAIPLEGFIENIINIFNNPDIVCAYGKQIPHLDANAIAKHARYFNYPDIKYESSKESVTSLGLKSVFMSNSFSAYRLSAFKSLGGFLQILYYARICISLQRHYSVAINQRTYQAQL